VSDASEVERSMEATPMVEAQLAEINQRLEDIEQILRRERFLAYLVKKKNAKKKHLLLNF